ncbi:glycosyl hydrolase family 95 catalytic domain-containing protein [Paenibacillus chungangensis]|uniref:Glycoside hydrolase N-terminal domain-containing protein n=1 Tax=Paenibacillus chungangensis TaxID=696535 RepID=A0ABW3HRG3_9BACL
MDYWHKLPSEGHGLVLNKAISRWDEALPLGNGLNGCLVWGNGNPLRFSLDRGDLWDLRPAPETLEPEFSYKHLIELVREGKQEEIRQRFDDIYSKYPYPTKLPAGRLEIDFGREADSIKSRLDIRTGCAHINLRFEDREVEVACYLHAANGLGYVKISGASVPHVLKLVPPDFLDTAGGNRPVSSSELASLGYAAAIHDEDREARWFYQRTKTSLEYAVQVAERQAGTDIREYTFSIASSLDGDEWFAEAKKKVHAAVQAGWDRAFGGHAAWWESYWSKSSISLPDEEAEKNWYLTNYFFASCSRKGAPPMPLQGVWTADEGKLPPWKGDYHHDLNTQLSYWHYAKANHLSEGESFIDFLWNLRPQAKAFAQSFFDAPGINLPSVMTLDGRAMGGWPMYSLSITNQIWLCQAFDHYWLHTGDSEFLREKAYVYLQETAECLLRWLKPGDDGKLRLPVSSSPEIHDNSLKAWLTPNSNYDLSLLIYLFRRLKAMADTLQYENDSRLWEETLHKLPELAVNEHNILMISPDEDLTSSHRHHSHAMAIYPLQLLNRCASEQDRLIMDATISNMEVLGKGQWVGYSFAWAAAMYAKQGNGEAALYHLQQLWRYLCSSNGFHLNGDYKQVGVCMFHYRPFTLEGNFAGACALQEMLLHASGHTVRVFPAIPQNWMDSSVEFRDFRGEKGVLVSAKISHGKLDYIRLYAERDGEFTVLNEFQCSRLRMQMGSDTRELVYRDGDTITVSLRMGDTCTITPSGNLRLSG